MRRKLLLPLILGGALSVAAIGPAAAAPPVAVATGGLVNVVVQAVLTNTNILTDSLNGGVVNVDIDDSLNNALQNVLQNARIANGLEITIQDVLNDLNINVSDIEVNVANDGIVVTVLGAGGIVDTINLI